MGGLRRLLPVVLVLAVLTVPPAAARCDPDYLNCPPLRNLVSFTNGGVGGTLSLDSGDAVRASIHIPAGESGVLAVALSSLNLTDNETADILVKSSAPLDWRNGTTGSLVVAPQAPPHLRLFPFVVPESTPTGDLTVIGNVTVDGVTVSSAVGFHVLPAPATVVLTDFALVLGWSGIAAAILLLLALAALLALGFLSWRRPLR